MCPQSPRVWPESARYLVKANHRLPQISHASCTALPPAPNNPTVAPPPPPRPSVSPPSRVHGSLASLLAPPWWELSNSWGAMVPRCPRLHPVAVVDSFTSSAICPGDPFLPHVTALFFLSLFLLLRRFRPAIAPAPVSRLPCPSN